MHTTPGEHLVEALATFRNRRAATALLGGMLAFPLLAMTESDARKKKKKKRKKKCKANSAAQTCAGVCGSVTNNCNQAVDCGACAPPCQVQPSANLQAAIDAAAAGSTLTLCAGTFNLATTVLINKPLTLTGAGLGQTVLDGGNAKRVLTINGPGAVTLQDLTVTRGRALWANEGSNNYGGGIRVFGADLTLRNVAVDANTASYGGGIAITKGTLPACSLVVGSGSRVSGNNAVVDESAGGTAGGILGLGNVSVIVEAGANVTGNTASFPAGGIQVSSGATITLAPGSSVTANTPDNCHPNVGTSCV
ncbi:MAG: hypothetical protein QM692_10625 [Thermomicrobiales bacterium]